MEARHGNYPNPERLAHLERSFPPLSLETRDIVPTSVAAYHLNRREQTLRAWSCMDTGPIRPVRLNGRLGWRVADIRRLVGVA